MVAEGEAVLTGVGVKNIILIAPSSGTGDNTFFPPKTTPTTIITTRKNPMIILIAATVLVRSSIYPNYITYTQIFQVFLLFTLIDEHKIKKTD